MVMRHRGFISNGDDVVKIIYPLTHEAVTVGVGGEVRAVDYDGEVHIIAAGHWTDIRIDAEQYEEKET